VCNKSLFLWGLCYKIKMSMYSKKNAINSLVSACRTKHLNYNTNLFTKLKFLLKIFFNYNISASDKNKTTYFLPNNKLFPREFIRLEPWELEYLFGVAQFCKKININNLFFILLFTR
jgi:hypothetical protein